MTKWPSVLFIFRGRYITAKDDSDITFDIAVWPEPRTDREPVAGEIFNQDGHAFIPLNWICA